MSEAERFSRTYARSSLTPMRLVSSNGTQLAGWGSRGRPARACSFDLVSRRQSARIALMLNEDPYYMPFDLVEEMAMSTVVGVDHQAECAIRGPLAVILVRDFEHALHLALATSGLDVDDISLTTAFDFDAVVAAALTPDLS